MSDCSHISTVPRQDGILGEPPTADGCVECLALGSAWMHLRRCLECGGVGCCDDSPNQHASQHARATGHPLMQSFEPNEDWVWCFVDQVTLHPEGRQNSPSHSG
jgi:uncharacterized UBP type Zn finger protein